MSTVDERLDRLEARVARLEHGSPTGPAAEATPTDHDEVFWALEGLKARVPDPGGVMFTGAVTLEDGIRAEWQQGFVLDDALGGLDGDAATTLAALGHPVRLALLRELLRAPRTAAELGELEGVATSGQIYHHLRQLVAAGWLRNAPRGQFSVPVERVVPLLVVIAAVAR